MRKLVLLAGLCMFGVLTFGAVAVAQTAEWRADQIAAAVESGQMTQAEASAARATRRFFGRRAIQSEAFCNSLAS